MGIITTEGYTQGFLPSMGYGGTFESPEPPITERAPTGIQIPAPQHKTPETEYSYDVVPRGHRDKRYNILINGNRELQTRYRQEDFVILDSYKNQFNGFHEPGAQFRFSDLLAYWPFDGDAVERLKDKSGFGRDLILAGTPAPTFIEGQAGNAIFFPLTGEGKALYDGSVFPDNADGFSSLSLSFWLAVAPLKTSEGDPVPRDEDALLFRHYSQTAFFDVHLTADKRFRVSMYDTLSNTLTWFSETPIITTSFFQHIVITYRKTFTGADRTLGIPIINLYVDRSPKLISLYDSDADAPRELVYGGSTILGTNSACVLDEFRIYGHDLTPSEVNTDFDYKAARLRLDTFHRELSTFDMWTV